MIQDIRTFPAGATDAGAVERNRVLRNTYWLLALSMVPTVLGAWLGVAMNFSLFAGNPLIGFVAFGKVPISSLQYGLNLKLGIAYATSDRPVKNRAMRAVLLLPFWMTAVLPSIIGFLAPTFCRIFSSLI